MLRQAADYTVCGWVKPRVGATVRIFRGKQLPDVCSAAAPCRGTKGLTQTPRTTVVPAGGRARFTECPQLQPQISPFRRFHPGKLVEPSDWGVERVLLATPVCDLEPTK